MKIKSIILFLFLSSSVLFAQSPRLSVSGFVGYTLQDNITFSDSYYGYIEDCAQYGGILEYLIRPTVSLGVSYMHMDTHIPIYDPYRNQVSTGGDDAVGLNYLMFEGTKYFGMRGAFSVVMPYVGVGAGMAMINVKNGDSYTQFAWDSRLGVKIKMAPRIALFAQVQLQSIVQGVGGGMYISLGGAGVGINTYSSVYQFSFGGGLAFSL